MEQAPRLIGELLLSSDCGLWHSKSQVSIEDKRSFSDICDCELFVSYCFTCLTVITCCDVQELIVSALSTRPIECPVLQKSSIPPAIRHFGRSVKTAHLSLKFLPTHNTFLIVQEYFPERPFVKCRTPKKIILNVAEHFLHHRTTSYRALYINNYTFGIFFIIFYLTINRKYNIIIYARRIFYSRPATNKAETQQRFHNFSLI